MSYEDESQRLDEEILHVIERWHRNGETLGDAAFDNLALRLFRYQVRYNAPYARYCTRLGMTAPRSWVEIPAVPAGAFKEAAVATFDPSRGALAFETSGTTGGATGRHYMETTKLYDAALISGFDRFMLPDGARLRYFNLVPNPQKCPTSSLGYMMQRVSALRGVGRTGWYVVGNRLLLNELDRDVEEAVVAGQPVCFATTAFALVELVDAMELRGRRVALPPGSRIMETGGFKGRSRVVDRGELYARAAERFGLIPERIVAEYGMTEMTSQYYDAVPTRQKAGPPWLRARVVGPDRKTLRAGIAGALLHVDLANRSSCIAVQTEDVGVQCENGFELLGRAQDAPARGCSLDAEALRVTDEAASGAN